MITVSDLPHGQDVIEDFIEAEGSVVVSQQTVPENIGEIGGCLIEGIILTDLFAVIPTSLDTTAIAEHMYQSLNK